MVKALELPPLRNRGLTKAMQAGSAKGTAFSIVVARSQPLRSELPTLTRNSKSGQFMVTSFSKKK